MVIILKKRKVGCKVSWQIWIFYSTVKNKRIKKLKIDLIWEISFANQNKYANTIGTLSIDFAPLPNFEFVVQHFSQIPPPKESPEATDTF